MSSRYYAHTPPSGSDRPWHDLREHLQSVSELAGGFGEAFDARDLCAALGLAHDLGKADARFQTYLADSAAGRPATSIPHAAAGAKACEQALGLFCMAALGHHAGLHDPATARERLKGVDAGMQAAAQGLLVDLGGVRRPTRIPADPLGCEVLLRFAFSALTDADYLDTEAYVRPLAAAKRGRFPDLGTYRQALAEHVTRLGASAPDTVVNRHRAEILAECVSGASASPGSFRLEVPTGSGKTLASMAFALDHALTHGLRRVICAMPYTSIIDQSAAVYAGVFGEPNVLAHHSALAPVDESEDQSGPTVARKLATENWDCPVIVTTTVQLFQSLFSRRSSRCRKLHRVARSVIILDEAQMLPPGLMDPILDILQRLIKDFGCTVLFCSATQPDYSGLRAPVLLGSQSLVSDPPRHFEALRRVSYRQVDTPMTCEAVAEMVRREHQALCVLNTRRSAVELVQACRGAAGLCHLSTLMCPDHRREVLDCVRSRLSQGLPVLLIATQVVEAGVDLDFPAVFRAIGPLDRVIQVAGRCNREGTMAGQGTCTLFALESGTTPRGWYATGTKLSEALLRTAGGPIDDPELIARYFRELYSHTDTDPKRIQQARTRLEYETVDRDFRMIDDDTVQLVVLEFDPEQAGALKAVPAQARDAAWRQRLACISVAVPRYEMARYLDQVTWDEECDAGFYWGPYDRLIGLGGPTMRDPADLVV